MSGIISGNMVGGAAPLKTLKIIDSDGAELVGVVVGSEVVFTADASSDIREGKIAATGAGIVTGSAIIPNYHTYTGYKLIPNGSSIVLSLDNYDYTKLQAIICSFNTSLSDSVSAEYVAIDDEMFLVGSTNRLSSIVKDGDNLLIDFGIVNTLGDSCLIRYFMYKELY